jgi:hypothetical protein
MSKHTVFLNNCFRKFRVITTCLNPVSVRIVITVINSLVKIQNKKTKGNFILPMKCDGSTKKRRQI